MHKRLSPPHYATSSPALKSAPPLLLLLMTVLSMVELPLPFTQAANPFLGLIALFYFTLWQPRYLPLWVIFLSGLLYDAFQTAPLGTYALLFLCIRLVIIRTRTRTAFIHSPWKAWTQFIWISLLFFILEWICISLLEGYNVFSSNFLWRATLTLVLYPLMHSLFSALISGMQSRF
jgi:rod shape-determining protein MreD